MATLAYTSAIQTRIYSRLGYALSTAEARVKTLIDGTWTSGALSGGCALDALTHVQQLGQYFWLGTPTTVPSEWESWLVARTVLMAGQVLHPDRIALYEEENARAEMAALDAFNRNLITYDPGSTPEATTLTIQNLRYYAVSGCVRRPGRWETVEGARRQRPRQWPDYVQVDSCIHEVIVDLWNRAHWPFKKRATTLRITPYAATGATYTESTKTITKTSGFATTIPAGSVAYVTSGTGATVGEYQVASATADTVVLTTSIGSAADGQTDIAVTVVAVSHDGLASESFHSVATREWRYADSSGDLAKLQWVDDTDMAAWRARIQNGADTGRPRYFTFETNGTTKAWRFSCIPDATYYAKGAVYVTGPTLTTLSATTTAMARFPAEFHPTIKNRVLGKVLTLMGDPLGDKLVRDTDNQIEELLPRYCDVGRQDDTQEVRDVNGDFRDFQDLDGVMGGRL